MLETAVGEQRGWTFLREECSGFVGGGGNFEGCGKRADKHCQHVLPQQVGTGEEENGRARRECREERVVTEVD